MKSYAATIMLALQLTACNAQPPEMLEEQSNKADNATLATGNHSITDNSFLDHLVAISSQDLAKRLTIDIDDIELISAQKVTWPNSSAGCPKPHRSYMPRLTEGALIRLRAAGEVYEYHSKASGPPFLCQRPTSSPYPDK